MDWVSSIAMSVLSSLIAVVLWQLFLQKWFHNVTTKIQSKYYDRKIRTMNNLFADVAKGHQDASVLNIQALTLIMIAMLLVMAATVYSSNADVEYKSQFYKSTYQSELESILKGKNKEEKQGILQLKLEQNQKLLFELRMKILLLLIVPFIGHNALVQNYALSVQAL